MKCDVKRARDCVHSLEAALDSLSFSAPEALDYHLGRCADELTAIAKSLGLVVTKHGIELPKDKT